MDFGFQKLAEIKVVENKQISQVNLDFFLFGANSCKSFVIGSVKFPDVQAALTFVDLEVNRFNNFLGDPIAQLYANNCYLEHTLPANSNYFTPSRLAILRYIQELFDDEGKDIADILKDLNDLNNVVKSTIADEKEALVVNGAMSVGVHSLQCWNDNLENWIELFYDELPNKFWGSLLRTMKRITKDDLAGTAGMAACSVVMNAIPGGGQVGYGAAIAGGTASASTYGDFY